MNCTVQPLIFCGLIKKHYIIVIILDFNFLPSDLFLIFCALCRVAVVLFTNRCCWGAPHCWAGIIPPIPG